MSDKYRMTTAQPSPQWARATVYAEDEPIFWFDTPRPDRIQALVADANRGAAAQQALAVELDALRERVKVIVMNYELSEDDAGKQVDDAFDAALKPKEHPDAAQAAGNP